MIAYKNKIRESDSDFSHNFTFEINGVPLTLTKNYKELTDIILTYSKHQNQESELIKIDIPDLTLQSSYRYIKEDENIKNKPNLYSSDVFKSNFDGRYDEEIYYESPTFYSIGFFNYFNNNTNNSDNYFNNEIQTKDNVPIFSFLNDTSKQITNSYTSLIQFQLLLEGYDILIPDFIVNDMILIAEKFQIQDLIDELTPLKNEIDTNEEYDRFSEIEILQYYEKILKTIDNDNFDEKVTFIYSIYNYIEKENFQKILEYFSYLYQFKKPIYSKICEYVNSKYSEFDFSIDFDNKKVDRCYINCSERKQISSNPQLLKIIYTDDVDSFQQLTSNPKFNLSNEFLDITEIKYKKICNLLPRRLNALELSAYFGSIKCFKYLLLNIKYYSFDLQKIVQYAIIGGNTEIIHLCHQNNYDFHKSIEIAIQFHQNDIARWIIENNLEKNIDIDKRFLISNCIRACNYELLQYFVDLNKNNISIDDCFIIKYVTYIFQNYNIDVFGYDNLCFYISRYKSIKPKNECNLLYCPLAKIEMIKYTINGVLNDIYNEHILNILFVLISFLIILISY